jgi:hypothetical protein
MTIKLTQGELRSQILDCREEYLSLGLIDKFSSFDRWLQANNLTKNLKNKPPLIAEKKLNGYRVRWENERTAAFDRYLDINMTRLYQIYETSLSGQVYWAHEAQAQRTASPLNLKLLVHEDNRRIISCSPEYRNFGILSDESGGCILDFPNWDLIINDVAFLAAVQARHDVAILNPVKTLEETHLWEAGSNSPRVTGREIVILQCAGYQRCGWSNPSMEQDVFFCPSDSTRTEQISLKDFCRAAKAVPNVEKILRFARTITMTPFHRPSL